MDLKLKKVKNKVTNKLAEQKKIYIFLIIVMTIGLILGIIYAVILNKSDYNLVTTSLDSFFTSIKNNDIDYKSALINSLIGNISLAIRFSTGGFFPPFFLRNSLIICTALVKLI